MLAWDFDPGAGTRRLRQQAEEQARQRAEQARQKALRYRAIDAMLAMAVPHAEGGSVPGMRKVLALLAERHDVTVETRETMPAGAAAYAVWRTRTIVVPPIVDAETFAIALHETGHVLAGECTGREPHRPDPSVTRWHHCIACETDAWVEAQKLVPFSREMFSRLQRSLGSYRRTTPAAAAEIERLDHTASMITWAEGVTRRKRAEFEAEQQARFVKYEMRLKRAREAL